MDALVARNMAAVLILDDVAIIALIIAVNLWKNKRLTNIEDNQKKFIETTEKFNKYLKILDDENHRLRKKLGETTSQR